MWAASAALGWEGKGHRRAQRGVSLPLTAREVLAALPVVTVPSVPREGREGARGVSSQSSLLEQRLCPLASWARVQTVKRGVLDETARRDGHHKSPGRGPWLCFWEHMTGQSPRG